jgi:fructose-1,6-bisphosphatase/inositol monophosphatase family enzyme
MGETATDLCGADPEELRRLLCRMQDEARDTVVRTRDAEAAEELSRVVAVTPSDTIYRIDQAGEEAILDWLRQHWPARWPVELVMEGLAEREPVVLPEGAPPDSVRLCCIIDPIDGTRGLIYDKRSAWVLSGIAPRTSSPARLSDIAVAAMTEIPTAKQRLADQVSAIRGLGPGGIRAERVDLDTRRKSHFEPRPSKATDLRGGFASFARFFPEAKGLLAEFEESLWNRLYVPEKRGTPLIFDDQYICSGGQLFQLLTGRDRMLGDLRPLALAKLGLDSALTCHPYDICTALIAQEAGCPIGDPRGGPLAAPLDTVTPVAWIGFANREIEAHVRPALDEMLERYFPTDGR